MTDTSDPLAFLASVFGTAFREIARPGGARRKTALYSDGDRTVAVSRRRSEGRAALEAEILSVLGPAGLSPRLLHHAGCHVVQEAVAGHRLPVAMARQPDQAGALAIAAWRALAQAQEVAHRAGLSARVPKIGLRAGWQEDLAQAPSRLGEALGVDVPEHDFGPLLQADPDAARFIKWDARPGNAMVRPDGTICWFDWEHAGARRRIDDAAWFWADEWAPALDACPSLVLETLLPEGPPDARDALLRQFHAMAVAHGCIRLQLIFRHKGNGPWWAFDKCLREDRIGITARHVRLLCRRLRLAAAAVPELRGLVGFFDQIAEMGREASFPG